MDQFDRRILARLAANGRLTAVELGEHVGLSPSAVTRRLQALQADGAIKGYRAIIDPDAAKLPVSVFVEITLERQDDEHLREFEAEVAGCPNVLSCHLMSGSSDYLLHVAASDILDFEALHGKVLGRLPGVARIESKFALREVVSRALAPVFEEDAGRSRSLRKRKRN